MTITSRRKQPKTMPQKVAYVCMVVLLFVAVLFILTRPHRPIIPNICPIDSQPAEWSKRQGRKDCEYGHFSAIEKQPHTWIAACPQPSVP